MKPRPLARWLRGGRHAAPPPPDPRGPWYAFGADGTPCGHRHPNEESARACAVRAGTGHRPPRRIDAALVVS